MKKFLLATLAAASFVCAESDVLVMQNSMYKMEMGLNTIQKGFLYNNVDMVKSGIEDIKSANQLFKSTDMKKFLPEDKKHMINIANNSSERIVESLTAMTKYLDKKEMLKSHESFGALINACTTCHSLVRSW